MEPVRILVADPLELIADGLRFRLADIPDMQVVDHVATGEDVLARVRKGDVDMVLMEVSMPVKDGIDTTRELKRTFPAIEVIAHSALTGIEYVNSMRVEGAKGYVVKGGAAEEVIAAVRAVREGREYLSPGLLPVVEKGYKFTEKHMGGEYIRLSERERSIIRLIALERTNEEISAELFLSVETVKTHRKNLMTKLNVRSAAGLVKYAVDRSWV